MTLRWPEARNQTTVDALHTPRQRESQLNSNSSPTTNRCNTAGVILLGILFSDESYDVNTLNNANNDDGVWIIFLKPNDSVTQFKMATGAKANVLPPSNTEEIIY